MKISNENFEKMVELVEFIGSNLKDERVVGVVDYSIISLCDLILGIDDNRGNLSSREREVYEILRENKKGLGVSDISLNLGISKGNVGSLIMGIRKKGIEIISVGGKYVLGEFVKIE